MGTKETVRRVIASPNLRLITRTWLGTVICLLAIVTFICGVSGFAWQSAAIADGWSLSLYKTVQLFLLNSGAEDDPHHPSNLLLSIARITAAGLFVVVSSTVIRQYIVDLRKLPRQLTQSDHVIVCGLGRVGVELLDDFHRQGQVSKVVVIELDAGNVWLEYARTLGAAVIVGDATQFDTLKQARVSHSKEVFIITGDDGVNLEIAAEVGLVLGKIPRQRPPLQVYLNIVDLHLLATLRPYCAGFQDAQQMHVHLINLHIATATQLITHELWPFAPKHVDEVAHFVIVGFGPMGQALAIQLAKLAHFPNRKRNRITIADKQVEAKGRDFLSRFPRFTSWRKDAIGVGEFAQQADKWAFNSHAMPAGIGSTSDEAIQYACNAEFVELMSGRADEDFALSLQQTFVDEHVKPVVFVCGQEDRTNFDVAMQLLENLANLGVSHVPVFVWLPRQPALCEAIARHQANLPAGARMLRSFGELRAAATYHELTKPMRELLARIIHADYETRAVARGERKEAELWEQSRDDFRESNRLAADHFVIKLAVLGLRIRFPAMSGDNAIELTKIKRSDLLLLGEMEHYRWVSERLLGGWRFAPEGETTEQAEANKRRRLSASLISWERLCEERKKDFDQVRTVLRECQKVGMALVVKPQADVITH